jgi:hypothetical protein
MREAWLGIYLEKYIALLLCNPTNFMGFLFKGAYEWILLRQKRMTGFAQWFGERSRNKT